MNYHIDTLPYDLSKKSPYKFDDDGVLLTKIPYTNEYHYHLTAIASYAIEKMDDNNVDWIVNNVGKDGCYHHDFVFPWYPMQRGWVGGLAQGLAISAMTNANKHIVARKLRDGLLENCYNSGIIYEYPNIEILNGWLYALFGLYDIGPRKLFNESFKKLKERIPFYLNDLYTYCRYDYTGMPSTKYYHDIVMKQMKQLYLLTNDDYILDSYIYLKSIKECPITDGVSKMNRLFRIMWRHKLHLYKRYMEKKKWQE